MTEQKTTEFLAALDDFVADVTDQNKALRFYTCLGNVKLYVLLEYGYPKVKINGDKKELLVYTSEPTELLNADGLSTVALGLERLAQELKNLAASGLLVDEATRNVSIPADNIFYVQALQKKATDFKLKTMPEQATLTLENVIRRIVKAIPEVTSAWLLGILLPGKNAYQYMVILEYDLTAINEVKQTTAKQIAENVTPLLADGQEIFIGTTEELAGKKAKQEFAPFYIKLNF
ncbi:enhanced serine sensitivity protein SseB C-terminal domain-containing protein [uncultured Ligilactobacillus sp.]|uniref:enhanced serine sensitivity protein SseB C-terminal domain-containing protein n=1 Tax=uncultured Ligilactobacillus sp. TaxID=2837633 RepID=UPI002729984B|nr:enhanced serine sensitivity protein SseB C-terminal domain-containing protein [uncultured Ligilactobacillus sp.]